VGLAQFRTKLGAGLDIGGTGSTGLLERSQQALPTLVYGRGFGLLFHHAAPFNWLSNASVFAAWPF
jgi:hypothetical protein